VTSEVLFRLFGSFVVLFLFEFFSAAADFVSDFAASFDISVKRIWRNLDVINRPHDATLLESWNTN
jgi:hypothetical protein